MAKFGKKFKTVEAMTKALAGDDAFAADVADTLRSQRLVRELFALRCAAGLTQSQLAEKLGWSQSQVSRLEHDEDRNVTVGELEAYAGALGLAPTLVLGATSEQRVEAIKWHAREIHRMLAELANLADRDQSMVAGVADFCFEAFMSLNAALANVVSKLPRKPNGKPHVEIKLFEAKLPGATADKGVRPNTAIQPKTPVKKVGRGKRKLAPAG